MVIQIDGIAFGAPVSYLAADTNNRPTIAILDATHFVVAWRPSLATTGHVRVGAIAGDVITYGAAVQVAAKAQHEVTVRTIDSTHVLISWSDGNNSNRASQRVGTISLGTTIALGAVFTGDTWCNLMTDTAKIDSTHHIWTYCDALDGLARRVTIAGNNLSYGAAYKYYDPGRPDFVYCDILDSTHFVVLYETGGTLRAKVGTLTGDAIAYGAEVSIFVGGTHHNSCDVVALDATHFVVTYIKTAAPNRPHARACSVAGNTITMGATKTDAESETCFFSSACKYDANTFLWVYELDGPSDGMLRVGYVDGITISWGGSYKFCNGDTWWSEIGLNTNALCTIAYRDHDVTLSRGICGVITSSEPGAAAAAGSSMASQLIAAKLI